MKKRLAFLAAFALAALGLVGVAAVLAAEPGPAYLQVTSWSSAAQNANLAKLSVTTRGAIPRQPEAFIGSRPVVGLAWADLDGATSVKVFATTIHPVLGRDSRQNPDAWHAHTATLGGVPTAPNDLCVVSIDSTPTAGIQIHDNRMDVNARSDTLPVDPSAFDAAVGFAIHPDSACPSGLAVRIVS